MNVARAELIEGWMSPGELRFLAKNASKYKIILEAGSYQGRSTRAMADNTKGVIHAIDPWSAIGYRNNQSDRDLAANEYTNGRGDEIYDKFVKNLQDKINIKQVIIHRIQFHHFWIQYPNMIFIDACHDYYKVKRDILHSVFLLCGKGGLICGHDYSGNWPGVIRAVDEVFGNGIRTEESIWWINL